MTPPEAKPMSAPLALGARIGVMGGGQLGRMLALAGADLGFDIHVWHETADSPAARVAAQEWVAPFDDAATAARFAQAVDAVTYEFENVPLDAAEAVLAAGGVLRPGAQALAVAQDRAAEKAFAQEVGAAPAPHVVVDAHTDWATAWATLGTDRAVLKTRRLGYDGKGQARVRSAAEAEAVFAELGGVGCVLEAFVDFVREVSVIIARGADGRLAPFAVCENTHQDGVLAETRAPAQCSEATARRAVEIAAAMAEALDYVGVLTVEFFETLAGEVLVNEIAPRVHNSGHWTREACRHSQFSQHMRAVAGWPLGDPARIADARMLNILGDPNAVWPQWRDRADAVVTLYGKRAPRPGRKTGHVVITAPLSDP